jgi:hypothetical protein
MAWADRLKKYQYHAKYEAEGYPWGTQPIGVDWWPEEGIIYIYIYYVYYQ